MFNAYDISRWTRKQICLREKPTGRLMADNRATRSTLANEILTDLETLLECRESHNSER